MRIGLVGTAINNENLGCVALTYSLVAALEIVAKNTKKKFKYTVFDLKPSAEKTQLLCDQIGVKMECVRVVKLGSFGSIPARIKHFFENKKMLTELKKCDVVIDLTEGDSFTDIYGQKRFRSVTSVKRIVEDLNIPLVLGPQTYGPFQKEENLKAVQQIINGAYAVIARDDTSATYIRSIAHRDATVTTDLAFLLPFNSCEKSGSKVRVGINVSALLVKNKKESGTDICFELRTDYDEFVQIICDWLAEHNDVYELFFIPHVKDDIYAIEELIARYPNANCCEPFATPIEAKNMISSMDVFIGARMHATIGAFSAGVATIPTAYSRKFKGLFDSLGYEYTVDLPSLSTEEAAETTIRYIENRLELQQKVANSKNIVSEKTQAIIAALTEIVNGLK